MATRNIIKLKKLKGEKLISGNVTPLVYLLALIPLKEQEVEDIKKKKDITDDLYLELVGQEIVKQKSDIELVFFIGELAIFPSYGQVVYEFPRTKRQIMDKKLERFRDYSMTLEKQKDILWYGTAPSNLKSSWNTAMKACGSKYGMIIKILQT